MVAPRQLAPAVAEAEQRVQLLDELAATTRPRTGPTVTAWPAGRLARDLEDRERDVEPAAQVDVPVGAALAALVAGRAQRLDQAVLEQQRPSSDSVAW